MPAIAVAGTDSARPGVMLGVVGAGNSHCGGLLPSEQRGRDDSVYTKRKCVTCPAIFFSARLRNVANLGDFTIFICGEAARFPAASVHGWRILTTKERGYAAAGVCESNACSVCECANDDGTE